MKLPSCITQSDTLNALAQLVGCVWFVGYLGYLVVDGARQAMREGW